MSYVQYSVAVPTLDQWAQLNVTVGGRLFQGEPLAKPCYENPTSAECAFIAKNYLNETFIASNYGGFHEL